MTKPIQPTDTPPSADQAPVSQKAVVLLTAHGLHARPAARLAQTAARFDAQITVQKLDRHGAPVEPATSAHSVSQLMLLNAQQGDRLLFTARGRQAAEALQALLALIDGELNPQPGDALNQASIREWTNTAPSGGIQAIAVSAGIAIGSAQHVQRAHIATGHRTSEASNVQFEQSRLEAALDRARDEISARRREIGAALGEQHAAIFDAQRLMLDDDALAGRARHLVEIQNLLAEEAWRRAVEELAARYQALPDAQMRQRATDVIDVGMRVMAQFEETQRTSTSSTSSAPTSVPLILIAEDFTPSQVAEINSAVTAGLIMLSGGADSHAAILMRALGLPAVAGAGRALASVPDGTTVAIDGVTGQIWIDPPPDTLVQLESRRSTWQKTHPHNIRSPSTRTAAHPVSDPDGCTTRDGARIDLAANVGNLSDARAAAVNGAEAIGVLRTEFLYLTRRQPPDEDEQVAALLNIAHVMQGRPVVVRTLDAGGDKALPYVPSLPETNPFLGVRAIRLSLQQRDLFVTQLRAILRAGAHHDVRILLPMISVVEEIEQAQACLEEAHHSLTVDGIAHRWPAALGVMVETPSAALMADALAERVDFLSIGTNDLTQYTLAVERGNARLAALADGLHPAILKLIKLVAEAATRQGKKAAVCGELAADPLAAPVLIGLGVTELSMNPTAIPKIKAIVRTLDRHSAEQLAAAALQQETAQAVRQLAVQFAVQRQVD
ncbi:MAG: phosphoenolpyruvate--protein phosphotransferase [Anaerolineae bacterium]|nr:phosphoenolpyruvate--protein phosphotransferase [Thermoflexales bacterium]MDW8407283.1 phosphoenolpyruvate--protein phosphotransferase [Anaerolineae bacterium]